MNNNDENSEKKIRFIEASEIQLRRNIEQIKVLILMLETIGSSHPQHFQLNELNNNLKESTKQLNKLSEVKNSLKNEI